MRKSDKKLDNQLRQLLTDVCDSALGEIHGFQWLTHTADYSRFPKSLKVVFVFDTNDNRDAYLKESLNKSNQQNLAVLVQQALSGIGVKLGAQSHHLSYDSEEACDAHHGGNWAKRLG